MERCNTSLGGNESVKLLWHDVHDINHWPTMILFTQKLLVRLYMIVYAFPACDFPCVESDLYTLCPCWLAISALYPLTCHRLSLCDAMFLLQRGLLLILHWSNSLKTVYFPSLANLNALLDQYIHIFCTLKEIIACNISNMVQCLFFFSPPPVLESCKHKLLMAPHPSPDWLCALKSTVVSMMMRSRVCRIKWWTTTLA